jgi:hypothetical protein
MRAALSVLGLLLALQGGTAHACGHCVEDKVAAVYDYAVVTQARAQRHQVAFFALDGTIVPSSAIKHDIEAAARSIKGVDKGSVRVSLELASLSFSFDPNQATFDSLRKSLDKKLASRDLLPLELKLMDNAATVKTSDRQ